LPRKRTSTLNGELFWVDRWNNSTGALLPLEARGLYREMLSQAWVRGARLPSNPQAIKLACRATDEEWERCWPLVSPHWRDVGGYLVNDTQLEVYARSSQIHLQNAEAGRKGMANRWANRRRDNAVTNAVTNGVNNGAITSGSKYVRTRGSIEFSNEDGSLAEPPAPLSRTRPDRHRGHVAPMACERGVCVAPSQHEEFVLKVGGDRRLAEQRVKTFYTDVLANLPTDETIAEDRFTFWRRQFAEHFKKPAPLLAVGFHNEYVEPAPPPMEEVLAARKRFQDEIAPAMRAKLGIAKAGA
jgi:uncharacterized protein YdaU (DUF1376 family)